MKIVRYGPGHTPIDPSAYPAYLAGIRDRLPPGARAYAEAPWHYDFQDHRCPHDAWVESLGFVERADEGSRRPVDMTLRLLGAYHDGHLVLNYTGVARYAATMTVDYRGHGDLMIDEITLEDDGLVTHEIAFEDGTWTITCRDVVATWIPLTN